MRTHSICGTRSHRYPYTHTPEFTRIHIIMAKCNNKSPSTHRQTLTTGEHQRVALSPGCAPNSVALVVIKIEYKSYSRPSVCVWGPFMQNSHKSWDFPKFADPHTQTEARPDHQQPHEPITHAIGAYIHQIWFLMARPTKRFNLATCR